MTTAAATASATSCITATAARSTVDARHPSAHRRRHRAVRRQPRRLLRQCAGRIDIGLFKTEVIRRQGPWRHLEAVEFATLDWVDWFNTRRLLEPIGYVPPAEYETRVLCTGVRGWRSPASTSRHRSERAGRRAPP